MSKGEISEKTPLTQEPTKMKLFMKSFRELSLSSRELFLLYGVALVETLGVMIVITGLTTYLSSVQDFSDVATGCVVAAYGCGGFTFSIFFGGLIDKYGLRLCLICGNSCALLGFVVLVSIANEYVQVVSILLLIAGGNSVVIPSIKLGVKHYANERAQSLGYSLLYIILFGAGAISGIIVDIALTLGGKNTETFNHIFLIGSGFLVLSTILAFQIVNIEKDELQQNSWEITKEVLKTKVFWKFMALTLMLVVVKALYAHLTITLPLYMDREIGDGAHFGYMLAIHKGIMVLCIPLLTSLVYYFNCYSLLVLGSAVSALGVIPLLYGGSYGTVIIFIAIVSVGESLYAPRLIDYTLSIAPRGKEGTFVALSSSPLSLGMIVAGIMGGFLLSEYCPDDGERNCWVMWGIIGIVTFAMPLLMLMFRHSLEEKYEDKNTNYN